MTKWECMRKISEQGAALKVDAVLMLLEWCDKPNTAAVTEAEAEEFLTLLYKKRGLEAGV